jgi:hypothetical protein
MLMITSSPAPDSERLRDQCVAVVVPPTNDLRFVAHLVDRRYNSDQALLFSAGFFRVAASLCPAPRPKGRFLANAAKQHTDFNRHRRHFPCSSVATMSTLGK